jgi:ABC-type transport system involved in cytochrome c biogenesis permease subunit
MLIDFLTAFLPLAYALVIYAYGRAFFSDALWALRWKRSLLRVLLGLHAGYLLVRTVEFGHPPATNLFEILTLIAFTTTAAYTVIESRTKQHETGYFALLFSFFFQFVSSLFIEDLLEVKDILRSNYFGLHVASALAGYSAITLSAVYGFLYLMLYHQIKKSRFGVIYRKLPSLENLERMSVFAIFLGFVFLALAMVAGFIWLPQAFTNVSYADPKLVGTFFIWLVYGVALVARRSSKWKGRRMMVVAIAGFAVSVFSMTAINLFFTDFHRFL